MSSAENLSETNNHETTAPVSLAREGRESRRTPRRVYTRSVGVLWNGQYAVTRGLQISEGGMLFRSSVSLPVKSQIVVSLVLPGSGDVIVTRGEVIYERPDTPPFRQIGVRFKSLPLNLRRLIRNYVTAKTQAEAEAEAESATKDKQTGSL